MVCFLVKTHILLKLITPVTIVTCSGSIGFISAHHPEIKCIICKTWVS